MRRINWTKLNRQHSEGSIWKQVVTQLDSTPQSSIDYSTLESLFGQVEKKKEVADTIDNVVSSPAKKDSMITFLDSKKSMNLNITLKAFKCSAQEVVEIIRECDSAKADIDHLRSLLKVLPDTDETGEVGPTVARLRPQLQSLVRTADVIHHSTSIKTFFAHVLELGNFINSGSYAGNATGFQLSTLSRIWDTRSNEAGLTLLHHIVRTCRTDSTCTMLSFTDELGDLSDVVRLSVETLMEEVRQHQTTVALIASQLQGAPPDVANKFLESVTSTSEKLKVLQSLVDDLEERKVLLANYFSEDEKKFRLEDCFAVFHSLCEKIQEAGKELDRKAALEAKLLLRQQREEERQREREKRQLLKEERQLRLSSQQTEHQLRLSSQQTQHESKEADSNPGNCQRPRKRRTRKPGFLTSAADGDCVLDQLLADISRAHYPLRGSL
ncbi:Formin FH2 domain [Trinorchestia longiramus]|nr:Formin FH2 domain [Trinorchestia longiramus]